MVANPVPASVVLPTGTPLFLPLPTTPEEFVFVAAVFGGALAVMFGIRPVVVLGVAYLVLIMFFVELLGPHPMLAVMIIGTAALARLIVMGGYNLGERIGNEGPETTATLTTVLASLLSAVTNRREED